MDGWMDCGMDGYSDERKDSLMEKNISPNHSFMGISWESFGSILNVLRATKA